VILNPDVLPEVVGKPVILRPEYVEKFVALDLDCLDDTLTEQSVVLDPAKRCCFLPPYSLPAPVWN
jgi:hypothetical protein